MHHVILIPGFFGFGALGKLSYFVGVREALAEQFARRGVPVEIIEVPTLPTASIRHRAAQVLDTIAAVAQAHDGPLHLVAHSTGGLDARLAIAPTASLPSNARFTAYDRVASLVTVSTPHFGTPLASFFGSAMGYPLLRVVSGLSITTLQQGRLPLSAAIRMGGLFFRLDDWIGLRGTVTDEIYADLLEDFSEDRRRELISFLQGVSQDQSLVFQLTPAGCDLLNACTADPTGVQYGCVVSRARPPSATTFVRQTANPYAQYLYGLYTLLHRIAGSGDGRFFPSPVAAQQGPLERAYGRVPNHRDSDGIVPTLSQVWGEVIHAAHADHLDVVGHFGNRDGSRVHSDWLPSASRFDEAAFVALWSSVADFVTRQAHRDRNAQVTPVGTQRTDVDAVQATQRVR